MMYTCPGALSVIGSLEISPDPCSSTLSLTWTPPFTLDIPWVDPDITGYCVDVIDFISSSLLYSQCGINRTEFRYSTPLTGAVFRVTPMNYAGNGTQLNESYSSNERLTSFHDHFACFSRSASKNQGYKFHFEYQWNACTHHYINGIITCTASMWECTSFY